MAELDPRKATILRAVIIEYVGVAEPIASDALVQRYEFGVRSATVRNELAEMAELGYLEQPHTSAGRVPSDKGYRYFVDRLLANREVAQPARLQVTSAASEGDVLQGLLRDTVRVLSRFSQLLAVASTVRNAGVSVKTAVVSALGQSQALVVLVLANGHVANRMIRCPSGLTLEEVGTANELLARSIVGKSLRSLARAKAPGTPDGSVQQALIAELWVALRGMARDQMRGTMVAEGAEYLLVQPEFHRDSPAVAELFDQLSNGEFLHDGSPAEARADSSRSVSIGKENPEPLQKFSMVRESFFAGTEEAGVLAVIGPTRMDYDRSIPLVSFTAQAITDALSRYFG